MGTKMMHRSLFNRIGRSREIGEEKNQNKNYIALTMAKNFMLGQEFDCYASNSNYLRINYLKNPIQNCRIDSS